MADDPDRDEVTGDPATVSTALASMDRRHCRLGRAEEAAFV
jgi:hypothetical protein